MKNVPRGTSIKGFSWRLDDGPGPEQLFHSEDDFRTARKLQNGKLTASLAFEVSGSHVPRGTVVVETRPKSVRNGLEFAEKIIL